MLLRVPEGVWVMSFVAVRRPERRLFQQTARLRSKNAIILTVPLRYHKSTGRFMFLKKRSEATIWLKKTEENLT